ncbi:MAG: SRPBCC family protein [Actinobacteria bacterium]|nr:SRPBCC family protein [Actinomycetota bacterium]
MEIENEFTVQTPPEPLWAYLLDVERVAPCMPGAELTETVDDHTWKGKMNMKLGPVSLSFAGTVTMQERDETAKRVVLVAKGMEAKGKGAANASITSWLEPGDGATTVKMKADIHMTGTVAQMSRGLLPEVSRKLTQQFADCLQANMAEAQPAAAEEAAEVVATATPVAKPIGGIRLGLSAIWAAIVNFFRRLFGKGKREG